MPRTPPRTAGRPCGGPAGDHESPPEKPSSGPPELPPPQCPTDDTAERTTPALPPSRSPEDRSQTRSLALRRSPIGPDNPPPNILRNRTDHHRTVVRPPITPSCDPSEAVLHDSPHTRTTSTANAHPRPTPPSLPRCGRPWIAAHFTDTGTHREAFRGVHATGRSVAVPEFAFYRVDAGQIAEVWGRPCTCISSNSSGSSVRAYRTRNHP